MSRTPPKLHGEWIRPQKTLIGLILDCRFNRLKSEYILKVKVLAILIFLRVRVKNMTIYQSENTIHFICWEDRVRYLSISDCYYLIIN